MADTGAKEELAENRAKTQGYCMYYEGFDEEYRPILPTRLRVNFIVCLPKPL